ncbi:hypothetical protein [Methylobacterium sp. Leaf100]|uniref:hypothetical protein n=1 Tax=Methylobacterium sp. Leaf100 TaxID=1736252 RepID=UPI0012E117A5|nr:hypothetical protein [Methylobacterium sp. Leaf100]
MIIKAGMALPCLLTAACSPSTRGGPDRLFPVIEEAEFVRAAGGPDAYSKYFLASGSRKQEIRNSIILARLYGIDLTYGEYESDLTREKQGIPFLATLTSLGLTSAAAVTGTAEMKTILAAAATGVTGVREAYDKEILVDRAISLIEQQMRTQRKLVRTRIVERLGLTTDTYPLELALTDVEAYYRAGTLTGALVSLAEDSGVRLREANRAEQDVVITRFSYSDLGRQIREFWLSSPENRRAVETWLRQNGVDLPVSIFVRSGRAADQMRMAADLRISSASDRRDSPRRENTRPRRTSSAGPSSSNTDTQAERIRRYFRMGDQQRKAVEAWLATNGAGPLGEFLLPSRNTKAAQNRMINELNIK